jgi:hypothetical protein
VTTKTRYGTDHRKINVDYYNEIRGMTELGRKYIADKLAGQFCENIKVPSTAINPPGQVSDPNVEATSGLLLFDGTKTELIYAIVQMPYRWQLGTDIHPHIHWEKTTSEAGNVAWQMRYKKAPVNGVRDADWTDLGIVDTPTQLTPDTDTADYQIVTQWDEIDMTGLNVEHSVLFELSRAGGDALDTYNQDARLISIDIHYLIDSPGGIRDFQKQTY